MEKYQLRIAILGAGVSSLAFLNTFSTFANYSGSSLHLFERSSVLSGRAATRQSAKYIYDNGANYFTVSKPGMEKLVLEELPKDDLVEIKKWIFPFDKNNKIDFDKEKASEHNVKKKMCYKSGIKTLGSLLYQGAKDRMLSSPDKKGVDDKLSETKLSLCSSFGANITKVVQKDSSSWEIYNESQCLGEFNLLVVGLPPKNLVNVLSNSDFQEKDKAFFEKALEELKANEYLKVYSLAVAFKINELKGKLDEFYAIINNDREHPIVWTSIENEKGRIFGEKNEEEILFIVQMSDTFSKKHEHDEPKAVEKLIVSEFAKLLPNFEGLEPVFTDLKLWRLALPCKKLNLELIGEMKKRGIHIIGDAAVGKGNVEESVLMGVKAAVDIRGEKE